MWKGRDRTRTARSEASASLNSSKSRDSLDDFCRSLRERRLALERASAEKVVNHTAGCVGVPILSRGCLMPSTETEFPSPVPVHRTVRRKQHSHIDSQPEMEQIELIGTDIKHMKPPRRGRNLSTPTPRTAPRVVIAHCTEKPNQQKRTKKRWHHVVRSFKEKNEKLDTTETSSVPLSQRISKDQTSNSIHKGDISQESKAFPSEKNSSSLTDVNKKEKKATENSREGGRILPNARDLSSQQNTSAQKTGDRTPQQITKEEQSQSAVTSMVQNAEYRDEPSAQEDELQEHRDDISDNTELKSSARKLVATLAAAYRRTPTPISTGPDAQNIVDDDSLVKATLARFNKVVPDNESTRESEHTGSTSATSMPAKTPCKTTLPVALPLPTNSTPNTNAKLKHSSTSNSAVSQKERYAASIGHSEPRTASLSGSETQNIAQASQMQLNNEEEQMILSAGESSARTHTTPKDNPEATRKTEQPTATGEVWLDNKLTELDRLVERQVNAVSLALSLSPIPTDTEAQQSPQVSLPSVEQLGSTATTSGLQQKSTAAQGRDEQDSQRQQQGNPALLNSPTLLPNTPTPQQPPPAHVHDSTSRRKSPPPQPNPLSSQHDTTEQGTTSTSHHHDISTTLALRKPKVNGVEIDEQSAASAGSQNSRETTGSTVSGKTEHSRVTNKSQGTKSTGSVKVGLVKKLIKGVWERKNGKWKRNGDPIENKLGGKVASPPRPTNKENNIARQSAEILHDKEARNKARRFVLQAQEHLKEATTFMNVDPLQVEILTMKAFVYANEAEKTVASVPSQAFLGNRGPKRDPLPLLLTSPSSASLSTCNSLAHQLDAEARVHKEKGVSTVDFGNFGLPKVAGPPQHTKELAFETMQILDTLIGRLELSQTAEIAVEGAISESMRLKWILYGDEVLQKDSFWGSGWCGAWNSQAANAKTEGKKGKPSTELPAKPKQQHFSNSDMDMSSFFDWFGWSKPPAADLSDSRTSVTPHSGAISTGTSSCSQKALGPQRRRPTQSDKNTVKFADLDDNSTNNGSMYDTLKSSPSLDDTIGISLFSKESTGTMNIGLFASEIWCGVPEKDDIVDDKTWIY